MEESASVPIEIEFEDFSL